MNLKFILMCFEGMSGLKINFEKSEAMVTGGDLESQLRAAHMMNCELGSIPMKYLGMPVSARALTMGELQPVVDKTATRVELWQGKFSSLWWALGTNKGLPNKHPNVCYGFLSPSRRNSCEIK